MRIILAGAGRLGREMAQVLVSARNEVTLVEQDDELVEQLKGRLKAKTLLGDACEPSVLEEAGALNTDILMATTGDDEDNLVISLLAKRYFKVPRVVARVNYPENQWLFTDRWGVDVAVSPSSALMALIQEATRSADTIGLQRLFGGKVGLIETTLTDTSSAVGKKLGEIALPAASMVAAVIRGGRPAPADETLELSVGDEVLVVSESATEADIRRLFQHGQLDSIDSPD
jgi:trk/ktr system potassium uptake protein